MDRWFPRVAWHHIERTLLIFGVLGASASVATGFIAEDLLERHDELVEMHEFFALSTLLSFGLLLLGECATFMNAHFATHRTNAENTLHRLSTVLERVLGNRTVSCLLAFVGLIAIWLTGLIGGVMAHGTSVDPLAEPILKLLGPY